MAVIPETDIKLIKMQVLFLPYYKDNPYQRELVSALAKEGLDIRFGKDLSTLSTLRSNRSNRQPNILHLHWTQLLFLDTTIFKTITTSIRSFAQLILVKLKGAKIVWTVHNIVSHESKFPKTELWIHRILSRLCNRLIVHCQKSRKQISKVYKVNRSSIVVVPHGNYINSYENVVAADKAREKLRIDRNEFVFLYLGAIRRYKGILDLIDAFSLIKVSKVKLLIVGNPFDRSLVRVIKKKCEHDSRIRLILDFIPDSEIQKYMNAANFVVLPFKEILTSGSLILAMSFGKAIVAPKIGCIPDVLSDDDAVLYDPDKKGGLFEALNMAMKIDSRPMGRNAYEHAKQYDWHQIAKKTGDVYKEC